MFTERYSNKTKALQRVKYLKEKEINVRFKAVAAFPKMYYILTIGG